MGPEHIEALRSFVPRNTKKNRKDQGVLYKLRLRLANEAIAALEKHAKSEGV